MIYPVHTVPIPKTESTAIPDLETAIKMTGADIAQSDRGYSGAGVKVAVMDTGLDVDHADLCGDGQRVHRIRTHASSRSGTSSVTPTTPIRDHGSLGDGYDLVVHDRPAVAAIEVCSTRGAGDRRPLVLHLLESRRQIA